MTIILKALAGALDMLPGWIWALIVVGAVGTAGIERHQAQTYKATLTAERLERAQSTIKQAALNAAETARRLKEQADADDKHAKELAQARADADRQRDVSDGLRRQAADAARRWSEALRNSPTPAQCSAAGDAIVLQSDLFGRAVKRAGELAAYADAARIAGVNCQQQYEALTPR